MGRAEGVKDKNICQGSQFPGKLGVVLLLFQAEAEVFHQHHLAGLEGGALGLGIRPHHVLGQGHGDAQQFFQVVPGREQGQLLLPLAVGTAHVRQEDHGGVVLQQIADGGQGRHDAGVVVNDSGGLVMGNVEVTAQEDLFPGDVDVPDGLLVIIHQKSPFISD